MEAHAEQSFHMQIFLMIFPCMNLHYKLVPVQYWEYEIDLFVVRNVAKVDLDSTSAIVVRNVARKVAQRVRAFRI